MSLESTPAERLAAFLARTPYIAFLGMRAELAGDEMTAILPFSPHLIGNTLLPALHGGVLGAFMEMTALAPLAVITGGPRPAKTIDYLRPGRAMDTYARAQIKKAGRRISSVHVEAWQEARAKPVAAIRGHFQMPAEG
jgi:acyl-coenzyme A thioesterase PaaI-like protein